MRTAREAKDWEFLMGKIANLSDLKCKHPWREIDKKVANGAYPEMEQ